MNNANTPLPNTIDGISGRKDISEVWRKHFCDLFTCIRDTADDIVQFDVVYSDEMNVTCAEVDDCISQLKLNKSSGLDGISAEHMKHCSRRIIPILATCFSGFMVHGFLPESMKSVVLIPIIKDKKAQINSKDNYRPVAVASVLSKVCELIILNRLSEYLDTHGNQFGFKPKLGTDLYLYVEGDYR